MAATLESIVKQLEDSGIVAPGKLQEFIPPKANPKTVEELLRELFKQNHLTKFQAQQVAQGKAKALILGGYTILDRIGAGGMGQVFKAQHRRMDRIVAIKMLPAAMTKDAAAVARFEREARAAAKLNHPNIVTAYDADQANGAHFLVMEYVEGTDLSVLVKKHGTLAGSKALNYILQAAKGLEFAHKKGVVHRDIKPANLLVDSEGTVKILDMGLARIDAGGDAAAQGELTSTGAVMGTVDYMAPEQALSTKGVDGRADVYSLGCTLYYLLAGKCTYDGDTLMGKLLAHREAPIPQLSDVQAGVSAEVQAIFAKMVAKKADDRYQSMTELIADLERAISGQSAPGNLAPPAGGTDAGLTSFFQQGAAGPAPKTKNFPAGEVTVALPAATYAVTGPAANSVAQQPPKKAAPQVALYGLIGGGVLSLVGIPLVLWLALSGGEQPPQPAIPVAKLQPAVPSTKSPPAVQNPTPTVATPPAGRFALQFSQRHHRVEAPNIGLNVGSPFTIEVYITPGNLPTNHDYYGQLAGISREFHLQQKVDRWLFYSTHNTAESSNPLVPNRRVHLAGVRSAEKRQLFVDGQLAGEFNEPLNKVRRDPSKAPEPLVLESPRPNLTLRIDQLRISQTARYTQNFTPPPQFAADAQTLVLYQFSEGTGTILTDSSGKGHHGQITGASWVHIDGSPITSTPSVVKVSPAPTTPVASWQPIDLLKKAKTDSSGFLSLGVGPDKQGGAPYFFDHTPIPEEYALELDLERQAGSAHTEIFLFAGGQTCSAVLGATTNPNPQRSGISLLDGKLAGNPENPTSVEGAALRDGQTCRVVCEVRKSGLRVLVDDRTLIDWTGDSSRLSAHEQLARSIASLGSRLGMVQWKGKVVVRRALLRPLAAAVVHLDDLPEKSATVRGAIRKAGQSAADLEEMRRNFSLEPASHSLMFHPEPDSPSPADQGHITYDLSGKYDRFQSTVHCRPTRQPPIFVEVWGDGKRLWESGNLAALKAVGAPANVDVRGVRELKLLVRTETTTQVGAVLWLDPRLTTLASDPLSPAPAAAARWPFDPADGKEYEWSAPENLGAAINTAKTEMLWAISPDERQLYFQREKAPFVAVRLADGAGFNSMNSAPGLSAGEHGSLSADGLAAAFMMDRGGGKREIWLASRKTPDQPFSTPQVAPPPINDDFQNDRAVLSADGLTLLTLSTRDPSAKAEIWLYTRPAIDQPFGTSERLGSPPNTPGWDMPYFISNDRCFLIASSQGADHQGPDRFVRYYQRAVATAPFGPGTELDIPLGTAARAANSGFRLAASGRSLYFDAPQLPGGQGNYDIWVTRRVPKKPAAVAAPVSGAAKIVYLDDLQETAWKDGHLKLGKHNLEFNGWTFTWRGQEPAHSLSTHPQKGKTALVIYRLNGQYDTFAAVVGLGDGVKDRAESPLTFRVTGDGRELWKSPSVQKLTDEAVCSISVRGVRELALEVSCSGGNFKAHGVWYEPRLTPLAASPPAASPLPIGTEVDLLPLVDLPQDALSGEWTRQGTELHLAGIQGANHLLRLPVEPGEEYSVRLAFSTDRGYPNIELPLEGNGVPISFNGDQVVLCLAGFKASREDQEAKNVRSPAGFFFHDNQRHEVVVSVSHPAANQVRIAVAVDGKPTLDWTGTRDQLKAIPGAAQTTPSLVFSTYHVKDSATKLLSAQLTTTKGTPKRLRPAAAK
ncbi:MAG: protein kinase [Pirellulaceae bacterium]|nr:protein kinase [Pirellulaceae bacterium]